MMGRRQILKGGDEYDVVCHAPLCVFDKPGVRKKTKRRMNKRWRKELRVEVSSALRNTQRR